MLKKRKQAHQIFLSASGKQKCREFRLAKIPPVYKKKDNEIAAMKKVEDDDKKRDQRAEVSHYL